MSAAAGSSRSATVGMAGGAGSGGGSRRAGTAAATIDSAVMGVTDVTAGGVAWAPSVLLCSPCDTCWPGSSPSDVAIVEPPHRGDRDVALDSVPLHGLVNRMFSLPARDRPAFQRDLNELLERYGS
eukprot:TRINITY_DN5471_c2_g1_i1.p1 TRINITY_DN5471_c2_g1~~TRINITY_DN5471_c2_g1_i1.p1  ORF type:complete len:145 (-),score=37.69 TRINITY_DN5471_c2_g1_i1:41-418(-)